MADSAVNTVGAIPWGSNVVNGQLIPQAPSSAFWPTTMGSQVRGPGFWPRQGTWQVPPVVPNPAMAPYMAPSAGIAGQSSSGNASATSSNPFHPTQGTIIFALGALFLGIFMLRYIHYGKG